MRIHARPSPARFGIALVAAVMMTFGGPGVDERSRAEAYDFSCRYRCTTEVGWGFVDAGEVWYFHDCRTNLDSSVDCVYRRM